MLNIYELIAAIGRTYGAQQDSWKGELHRLVMRDIYACIDAESLPFEAKIECQQTVNHTIKLLLDMVPEGGTLEEEKQ